MSESPARGEVSAPAGSATVDDSGVTIDRDVTETVDVLFDGERVWSFLPTRYGAKLAGKRRVAWPKLLKPHLNGTTRVVLREHGTDDVLLDAEHVFGSGEGRVRFVNAQGGPKVIDKWGFVQQPLSSRKPTMLNQVLDTAEEILGVLADDCDLPAWIAFGSLLGAVREGKVIAHDSDLDVAYLSKFENPVDVAREMFRVSRALQRQGMKVLTKTGSFVTVIAKTPDGQIPIDVYACFYVGDVLYESASVGTPVPREVILPLGTVSLEGRELPAPADPARLLEVSYGAGWAVPDPGFRYEIPASLSRRFLGWFGTSMRNRRYWDRLYEETYGYRITDDPSPFAQWVLPQLSKDRPLLDVGCGNGRDTLWFAEQGVVSTGLDYSRATMVKCRAKAAKRQLPATFTLLNLNDIRDSLVRGSLVAREQPGPRTLYARFLLHALDPPARENFWHFADMTLRGGGEAFFEFRTRKDVHRRRAFDKHFCEYLRPKQVFAEIRAAGGEVVEQVQGVGLSPYEGEDPYLCRVKVVWKR